MLDYFQVHRFVRLGGAVPLKRPTPHVTPEPEGSLALRHLDQSRARRDRALFERYLDERDAVDREMLVERFLPLPRRLARV
jgi:hypothetical protein